MTDRPTNRTDQPTKPTDRPGHKEVTRPISLLIEPKHIHKLKQNPHTPKTQQQQHSHTHTTTVNNPRYLTHHQNLGLRQKKMFSAC